MKTKCLECGIEFDAARPTARFHNASCRVKYSRKQNTVEAVVKAPIIKKARDLPVLKPTRMKAIPALRITNPLISSRMTFGGTVSKKRINYDIVDGTHESLPYTD